jgi:hypothetical protein
MKKAVVSALAFIGLVLPISGQGEEIPINKLLMQNFVDDRCHDFKPLKPVFKLDERFYNKLGWGTGATSCKGEICWSGGEGGEFLELEALFFEPSFTYFKH